MAPRSEDARAPGPLTGTTLEAVAMAPALVGRLRAPVRPAAAAHRLGRRGRARGAGRDAREALDQERVEGAGARARGADDGPDDARGADTPGKVAALCSKAMRPDPVDRSVPVGRRGLRLPEPRPDVAKERLAGSGVKVASVATAFPSGQSPTDAQGRRDASGRRARRRRGRHGDRPRRVSLRPLREGLRRDRASVKEACGDAHLKVILETGELGTYDNVRRASLLAMAAGADFIKTSTGKVTPGRDAAGDALHARGDPRRPRRDRARRRHEARGRDPHREAGDPVPRVAPRDARAGLDDARPLPLRRVVAAQRRADADPQGEDRRATSPATTSPID